MARTKISKFIEVVASSPRSFEDAVEQSLHRANQSLAGIREIDIQGKKVLVEAGKIVGYEVCMNLIFELAPDLDMHA